MAKTQLKKEKWTISIDANLKKIVIQEARAKGIYPVNFIEELVREKINPYGHTDIIDSVKYVRKMRKASKNKTDEEFLEELFKSSQNKPTR